MDAVIIGPLALPATAFVALIAILVAQLGYHWWQKQQDTDRRDNALWLTVLVGLLGARLAFVWRYQEQYSGLVDMLDVRDGGWWWPGALAAVPIAAAYWWKQPQNRRGLQLAMGAGLTSAALVVAVLLALRPPAAPLPDTTLFTLQGKAVALQQITSGQLTLINLWATWCPPCRREMPVLQAAQTDYPQLRIVLANQGENPAPVRRYLTEQALQFDFLLLDPHTQLGEHAGSSGLPLTLLVDAEGNELARHFGPLSPASLHHFVQPHLPGVSP